ncbi:hypothetical protein PN502_03030, partial [Microcystis aeruginosa CS-338/01]|uniref:hypothetical protein n=1 Tax=Microcystis aeruginosa TaxID=1126 RepID=UPI00232CCD46
MKTLYIVIIFGKSCQQTACQTLIGSSVCLMQWTGVIRDGTLIYKGIWRFLSIAFDLKRANQLNSLPDKD